MYLALNFSGQFIPADCCQGRWLFHVIAIIVIIVKLIQGRRVL